MKRYMMPGLYASFCLSWAGAITCVVLHEDVWGRWLWMLSVCAALLFTLLLILVWLWRLVHGLYRWHPAVREVLFLLVAGMLCCWGFRGFSPITWYLLDVSCCSGVGTTPTWHVSPWQRAYMLASDDWSAGRFGHRLVANDIEFHQNYFPRVGHGPCAVRFGYYEGGTKGIADAFILDLPRDAAAVLRMRMAASSSALGVIVSHGAEGKGAYARYAESNLEPRQWCEKEGYLWLPASPGGVLELPVSNGQVTFFLVYCPGLEDDAPEGISPYNVLPFRVTRMQAS